MDLREILWGGMNWLDLAQDRGSMEWLSDKRLLKKG
jgi:hypothetical protein